MKLVLPTGPGGEYRTYPADNLVAWATMAECQALLVHTGISQDYVLEQLLRGAAKGAPRVTEDADLMRANMGMVWLVRYRAGERAENGEPFTLAQACDFPLRQMQWIVQPGDLPAKAGAEDPPQPPADGKPATAGGEKKAPARSRSRSASRGSRS